MNKLFNYILKIYFPIFINLFFIFSLIISLIFIISISNITSGIQITFLELLRMYILSLPQIILITLSISFFVAANSTYARLSETQELVAMFSLGFKPLKVLKPIILIAFIFTILSSFILLISIPYSKMAFSNLKNEKKQEAKFNLKSQQISQKFEEWVVFALANKNEKSYQNIYLFNPKEQKFIISSNAVLDGKKGILKLALNKGKIYDFNNSYKIEFNKMEINKKIPKLKISIFDFKNYFKHNKKLFTKYIPIALLPIALIFFIPVISFFHPRLHKNHSLLYSIIVIIAYFIAAFANKNIIISIFVPILFLILGGILYKWKVKF